MSIPSIQFEPATSTNQLLEIIDLDDLYRKKDTMNHSPEKPHRMGFSILLYFQNSSGTHFIDFKDWQYQSGSLLFINKHQINAFDLSHRPQGKAILFTDTFIEQLQISMKSAVFAPDYLRQDYSPVLHASSSLQTSCDRIFAEIAKETQSDTPNAHIIMLLFSALLLLLEKERPRTESHALSYDEKQRFSAFIHLLETQFIQTRHAADYADQLHITYKTLNQLCKKASQSTAKQLIDAYTVLEAKRRLVIDQKRIQNIAYDLGFDEVTNFTKYFRKHTQCSPSEFRRSI